MKAQAERSLVRLPSQNKDVLLCLHTMSMKLYDGKKYSSILKCAKHYETKECGYNSKERLAYHLFRKIVNAYLMFFIRDLVKFGLEIHVPGKNRFYFKIYRINKKNSSYEYDSENSHKFVSTFIRLSSSFTRLNHRLILIPTNKLKKMIVSAYKEGTRYKFKNIEAYGK